MSEVIAKILVVDDQPSARETINAILTGQGYVLEFAESGKAALELLATRRFDLILCDVMMPGMSGFEVCESIKANPDWMFTPVVLVTALDSAEDIARGLDAGADDFVSRPFDTSVFRARIRARLRLRSMHSEAKRRPVDVDKALEMRRKRIVREANLSTRETEVLELILLGRSHQEIASALDIRERTSKFHLHNIIAKLGAESRADLLRIFA